MVKQASFGPFIRNLLYNPEAKKYLKYPMHTSYEMWQLYDTHRKSTGRKGITNQNWNKIMYILKKLELIVKIEKPKRSITPVPGEKHPSGYIPNTYLFTWEHIILGSGETKQDAINSLFNFISEKHNINWLNKASIKIVEGNIDIYYGVNIVQLVRNIEMNKIEMYTDTIGTDEEEKLVLIDILEIQTEKEAHMIHFMDICLDWKRVFYKAIPENINSESWNNPQLAYRIQINSISLQQELATKEIERQWKRLIKEYTSTDTNAEINIDTLVPDNYSPELKEIIDFYRSTGYTPYHSLKKIRDIVTRKKEYIDKIIIPPRKDFVTIKVTKQLKDKIDAERGEMTISDYLEMKL